MNLKASGFFCILNFITRDVKSFHLSTIKRYFTYFSSEHLQQFITCGHVFYNTFHDKYKMKTNGKATKLFHSLQGLTNKTEQKQNQTFHKDFPHFSDTIQSPVHHIPE